MRHFLEILLSVDVSASDILLIAPPKMRRGTWVEDEALIDESLRLGQEYKSVSEALGIRFVDSGKWDLDLCFDGVHLSEAGHLKFAENMCLEKEKWHCPFTWVCIRENPKLNSLMYHICAPEHQCPSV
jgi:hypothetical protein